MKLNKTKTIRIAALLSIGLVSTLYQNCSGISAVPITQSAGSNSINSVAPGVETKQVSQEIQVTSSNAVDVLFVVDNSGSMTEEQAGLAAKIANFMNLVKDLDWQIALTTTDPNATTKDAAGVSRKWGQGEFRPFDSDTGSLFVLKSTDMNYMQAQTYLGQAINVGIVGGGTERGIYNTYKAIEKMSSVAANANFFRANSKLAVILISDEDECSTGACSGQTNPEKSVPDNLVAFVKTKFAKEKVISFNSIIKIPNDTSNTAASNYGVTYQKLSQLTGGVVASVAAADYTSALTSIGTTVLNLLKSVNLECVPLDMNKDGISDVSITLPNGSVITSGFTVSGSVVTMDSSNFPEGKTKFNFTCKK